MTMSPGEEGDLAAENGVRRTAGNPSSVASECGTALASSVRVQQAGSSGCTVIVPVCKFIMIVNARITGLCSVLGRYSLLPRRLQVCPGNLAKPSIHPYPYVQSLSRVIPSLRYQHALSRSQLGRARAICGESSAEHVCVLSDIAVRQVCQVLVYICSRWIRAWPRGCVGRDGADRYRYCRGIGVWRSGGYGEVVSGRGRDELESLPTDHCHVSLWRSLSSRILFITSDPDPTTYIACKCQYKGPCERA